MKLLFLDIDGVLNSHEHDPEVLCGQIHRDKVQLLNHVLRVTGAKVVLSSAWRYLVYRGECNLMGLEWLLRSHGMIANRLVGITRKDTLVPREDSYSGVLGTWPMSDERGAQIRDYLADSPPVEAYAVLDDMDLGIVEAGHPFVWTDGDVGLVQADMRKLIELLGEGKS